MKTRYFVSFSVPRSEGDRVKGYIKDIGLIEFWEDPHNERALPHMYHTLDGDDPKLAALRALLKREGIEWSEREEHVYTDAELRSFPFLELYVEREPLDRTSLQYGTTYDLSKACPACGTGAIQTSPLMVPLSGFPKKGLVCAGFDGETLVGPPLIEALQAGDVKGLELRQVRFYRNDEPLPWWQMIASFEMPRMSPKTRGGITDETDYLTEEGFVIPAHPPCPRCRRDGRYHSDEPYEIAYSRRDVDPAAVPDVAHKWESFGVSGVDKEKPEFSRFGDHRLLVKPKVFDIFRRLRVRQACFVPVRIVD